MSTALLNTLAVPGAAVHASLRRLAREQARVEMELGRGLWRLTRELSIADLGHARREDWCHGRYGVSWSLGRQLRLLHVLPGLPRCWRSRRPRTRRGSASSRGGVPCAGCARRSRG